MKHKNSISQVNIERDRELLRMFRVAKKNVPWPTSVNKLCDYVIRMPASRFYISEEMAVRYVRKRMNGRQRPFRNHRKCALYEAFYREFLLVKSHPDNADLPLFVLVYRALQRPAPFIGVSHSYLISLCSSKLGIH